MGLSLSDRIWGRALASLSAIKADGNFFALGEGGKQRVSAALERAGMGADQGADDTGELLSLVMPGVHCFQSSERDAFGAFIHVGGSPQWGPLRSERRAAKEDRKFLLKARQQGCLPAALRDLREGTKAQGPEPTEAGGAGGQGRR